MSDNLKYKKEFSSWGEFVEFAENAPSEVPIDERSSRSRQNDWDISYKDFTHAENWEEVLKLSKEGWPDGLKKSKEISNSLFNHVSSMIEKMDVVHDIEGHSIDVARFIDGEPESWLKFQSVIQESDNGRKLIKITFNCSVSGGVPVDIIIARGAAIVALIELLEYSGYRVQLTLVHAVNQQIISSFVRLKEFDQNLNLPMISYALAHPSVLRALMFSVMETAPKDIRQNCGIPGGGYGQPGDILKEDKGDIHISEVHTGRNSTWESVEKTENWIIEELKKVGIQIKMEEKLNGPRK